MKVAQNKRFRFGHLRCRSPHGERGLKCLPALPPHLPQLSLPARGAWIEIDGDDLMLELPPGGRSPHGERGLKYGRQVLRCHCRPSLPARGAWIEISRIRSSTPGSLLSLPARGAWIEMAQMIGCTARSPSLPARGAWIEISTASPGSRCSDPVAPRTGSVD